MKYEYKYTTWGKLNKSEKAHLKEMKINTKWQFEEQAKFMKKELQKPENQRAICEDCMHIAHRLKLISLYKIFEEENRKD